MTFFRSTNVDLRFRIATLSIAVREKNRETVEEIFKWVSDGVD